MASKDVSKEIGIKNCTFYHFDDLMTVGGINFNDILLDQKSYGNILIYDISQKTFMVEKPLRVWLEKVDVFIKVYYVIRYLILFASEKQNAIYDRINYLISEKVVLDIVLIIIQQELEWIHIILYLQKRY